MEINERKGWLNIITAEDIDFHMADIKQAETNAYLVVQMFKEFSLKKEANLWIPGCGTCQMFDYISPFDIGSYEFTFTDLGSQFFEKAKARLSNTPNIKYVILENDIEHPELPKSHYDGVLTVLLLQHINDDQGGLERGLDSILRVSPYRSYFIIQEQESGLAITKERELRSSIKTFSEIANAILVPRNKLIDYLETREYNLLKTYERSVPDKKTMVGLVFEKK